MEGVHAPRLHIVQFMVKQNVAYHALPRARKAEDTLPMNLAKIRAARGLSQKDLGEMIGKTASTIQRAEVMSKTAKLETYVESAKALNVPLAALFLDDLTPDEVRLIEAFRAKPEAQRERMVELLDLVTAPPPPSS